MNNDDKPVQLRFWIGTPINKEMVTVGFNSEDERQDACRAIAAAANQPLVVVNTKIGPFVLALSNFLYAESV